MLENTSGSPIFADRYRFQPVKADWDVGRSGFTHLLFDIKKERLGVIKRAELKSQRAVEALKNEIAALLDGTPMLDNVAYLSYIAGAWGNIDSEDVGNDTWTIDKNRDLVNRYNDVNFD